MPKASFFAPRAVAQIDRAALAENFRALSHACGRTIAVVKANAYGHGLAQAVPPLLAAGCTHFALATVEEGEALRKLAPFAEILLLGYLPLDRVRQAAELKLVLCVFSLEYALALSRAASRARVRLRVHLKIDCGMCRLGFPVTDTDAVLRVFSLPFLHVCGIFTHFPTADTDPTATRRALDAFLALRAALPVPLFAHAAASAAALTSPRARLDAVRVGIALYGYPPVPTTLPLRPAMRLCAPVIRLQRVAAGTPVGYGGAFVTARPTLIGTVSLGYGDGIPRALGGFPLTVLCGRKRYAAPILGRVCMDHCMLDMTDIPQIKGQTVCFLEDFAAAAQHAGTIPYELLTAVSARVERRWKGEL